MNPDPPTLVLASTSRYRRQLLERLRLPFVVASPDVHEQRLPGEAPAELAQRLAAAKATAIANQHPGAWVIGSDQVAALDADTLGKPGTRAGALAQLAAMSGRRVAFFTAVSVMRADGLQFHGMDETIVSFRDLRADEIARYVDAEQPFDCAGSFKCEGLGIALFDSITSRDPTALVGLPLILTARLLRQAGFAIP